METQSHYLPLDIRAYIIAQAENGLKYNNIIENVQQKYDRAIYKGTISKIIQKFRETGYIEDKPKTGRPNIFNDLEKQAMVQAVENDRMLTGIDVHRNYTLNNHDASVRTVQSIIKEAGLIASTTCPISISEASIERCVSFANDHLREKGVWSRIVFSDESDLFPYKSRKLFIRRYRGEHPLAFYNMNQRWGR